MRHRVAFALLVVFAVAGLMQHELSDGGHNPARPEPPPLWEAATHAASAPAPPGPCVLVIPFAAGGTFTLTSPEDGVAFDLDGDGEPERVSWTEPGADVAWLAVDRDGDGRIESGRELVGDRMMPQARSAPDALLAFANEGPSDEHGGVLHSGNAQFLHLMLWTDRDHDGHSDGTELRSARHVLSDIGLGFERHHRRDRHGNESRYRGFVHVRTEPRPNRAATAEEDSARMRWLYDACLIGRSQ